MKKYLSFFTIRFLNGLQYRAAAVAGMATQFAWGYMRIKMFLAFSKANPAAMPMEFDQLASYIWLQQAFLAFFAVWILDNEIFEEIRSGNVAYELCRPLDLYNLWFVKNLAMRLSRSVLRCFPILFIALVLPKPLSMSLPQSPASLILFLISLALGLFVSVAFCMVLYITTFFTLSPAGVRVMAISLVDFLSGGIIPLPMLPEKLLFFLELLPFASMTNTPLRVYSGHIAGTELAFSLGLQLLWLTVLVLLGRFMMKRALTRVVVQGG